MISSRHRHLIILITVLITIGLSTFAYRWLYLKVPLQPDQQTDSWVVEANIHFSPGTGPIKATLRLPLHPPGFENLDETFLARNYGLNFDTENDTRQAIWTIRRASGSQSLYYRTIFYADGEQQSKILPDKTLPAVDLSPTKLSAAESIIKDVRAKSADIVTFTAETIKTLADQNNENAVLLLDRIFKPEDITRAAVKVLTLANIHTRYVQGIKLTPQKNAKFQPRLAVYDGKNWQYFDPSTAQSGLGKDFLIWAYGPQKITDVVGANKSTLSLTVSQSPINALEFAKKIGKNSELIKLSLFSLPLQTQQVYYILLTVPIGAFVILILRNFVGLITFGTFMPVLVALAFRETKLLSGIVLFTMVVSIGLLVRFYLDQLRLLLVPRLTAILTSVILLMMFISLFSQQTGYVGGLSIALFPMVIMTMTIERMCILWDERGPREAVQSGVGSLIAASLAYLSMHNHVVEYIFFAFPELLLVLLAIILMMGQYRGYRLSELKRFKAFLKMRGQ